LSNRILQAEGMRLQALANLAVTFDYDCGVLHGSLLQGLALNMSPPLDKGAHKLKRCIIRHRDVIHEYNRALPL